MLNKDVLELLEEHELIGEQELILFKEEYERINEGLETAHSDFNLRTQDGESPKNTLILMKESAELNDRMIKLLASLIGSLMVTAMSQKVEASNSKNVVNDSNDVTLTEVE